MRSEDELVALAASVAEEILDSWFFEYSSWDCIEDLTQEEYDWIQENIRPIADVIKVQND